MQNPFKGTLVPLVTPFRGGRVDYTALRRVIARCQDGGVDGFVCNGTTAEAPTLSERERRGILAFTLRHSSGMPVIAGAGSNCTAHAVKMARQAETDGANGVLSVCPYYNNPPESGIIAHFSAVADAVRLPVILYDVPSRTGVEITANAIAKLRRKGNIVAVKAAGDINKLSLLCSASNGKFGVLGGNDALIGQTMKLGGVGMISAAANAMPKTVSDAVRLYGCSVCRADELVAGASDAIAALYSQTNPVAVKYALHRMGLIENELRLPMCPLSHKNEALVESYLHKYI